MNDKKRKTVRSILHAELIGVVVILAAVAVLVTVGLAPQLFAVTADATVETILVEADSYVESGNPNGKHGSDDTLWVDGAPQTRSYLRFQVGPQRPAKAVLRLYITKSSQPFEVRSAASAWQEQAITYANAPAYDSLAVRSGPVAAGKWADVDVTSLVKAGGAAPFVLNGLSKSSQAVAARERGSTYAPRLLVTPPVPNGADVTPHTVSISSPKSGHTISAASVVDIRAVTQGNAGVATVQFFQNGSYRGEEDTALPSKMLITSFD